MVVRTRARNQDELISLIKQTLDEVEDLRAAIEFDEEFMAESSVIVEPLKNGLTQLLAEINTGQYQTREGNSLDFINVLKDIDHRAVPCWPMLRLILETHQSGYQQADSNE